MSSERAFRHALALAPAERRVLSRLHTTLMWDGRHAEAAALEAHEQPLRIARRVARESPQQGGAPDAEPAHNQPAEHAAAGALQRVGSRALVQVA